MGVSRGTLGPLKPHQDSPHFKPKLYQQSHPPFAMMQHWFATTKRKFYRCPCLLLPLVKNICFTVQIVIIHSSKKSELSVWQGITDRLPTNFLKHTSGIVNACFIKLDFMSKITKTLPIVLLNVFLVSITLQLFWLFVKFIYCYAQAPYYCLSTLHWLNITLQVLQNSAICKTFS